MYVRRLTLHTLCSVLAYIHMYVPVSSLNDPALEFWQSFLHHLSHLLFQSHQMLRVSGCGQSLVSNGFVLFA